MDKIMEHISENTDFKLENTAIALGKFDGMHRGHQLLLNEILSHKKEGYLSAVFTFDVSPARVVKDTWDGLLMTRKERLDFLSEMGIDAVIEYPFTKEFSRMEPEAFVRDILIGQMDMRILVVGEDFRFGRNQTGDVRLLQAMSQVFGFQLIVIQKRRDGDRIISSTAIKELVKHGQMEEAAAMMGHPYMISGEVCFGNRLGRTIGYPTANLPVSGEKVLPPLGVYAAEIQIGENSYKGIANLGKKPTVQEAGGPGLEVFIFDFDGELYGQDMSVFLLRFIRAEQRFDSLDALTAQIQQDVQAARRFFA